MSRYQVAPRAQVDIDDIWFQIAPHSLRAADRLVETFYEKFRMLARQPLIGEACDELSPRLRNFPAGNYVIFYRPARNGISVVRVLHGARDIPALFENPESNGNGPS